MRLSRLSLLLVLATALLLSPAAFAQEDPSGLTRDQMREFLLKAKIVKSRDIGKGVTSPKRLTLTNGTLTHDGAFQAVDERQTVANLSGQKGSSVELNFVDAYRYNLAAYELSKMLDIDHMMPVHVERGWNGKTRSLSWWADVMMDEGERLKKKVEAPNPVEWNNQMYRMRVFSSLVRDTDRNLGNVLITPQWKLLMIDFTRAFRLHPEIASPKDLSRGDRALLAKLETLNKDAVKKLVKDYLTGAEIDAMIKRRDLIVAHYKQLVAEKGEAAVLY
jgi:hypothetical protein